MKTLTKRKKLFLVLGTVCLGILLGIVLLNLDFSAKHVSATEVDGYSGLLVTE